MQNSNTVNLEVKFNGNFIVIGRDSNLHIWGGNSDFEDTALNEQMETVRTNKGGIITVTIEQCKLFVEIAMARVAK